MYTCLQPRFCSLFYKKVGQCGSPVVYSLVETVESYNALMGKPLIALSIAQLASCTEGGCAGGVLESYYTCIFIHIDAYDQRY